jgi:hypothetical protein
LAVGAEAPSLLAGLIVDADGSRMTPTHATKKAKRYRYYVSASLLAGDHPQAQKGMRVPAGDIEALVLDRLRAFFSSRTDIGDALTPLDLEARAFDAALRNACTLSKRWLAMPPSRYGELTGWIELFAFSHRPSAVLDAPDLLPANRRNPWDLRRLLDALGNSPHADALHACEELTRRDPRFLNQYEWLNAVITLGTEAADLTVLDHVCNGTLAGGRGSIDAWRMSDHLEGFARKFPAFCDELARRYTGLAPGPAQQILELALAKLAGAQIILTMIASHAVARRTFRQGPLGSAIYNMAVGRRPVEDWPGAVQEFSVSLNALRKDLFGLVLAGNDQSALVLGGLDARSADGV